MAPDRGAGADVSKGADVGIITDGGVIDLRAVDVRVVADLGILEVAVRADGAAAADGGVAAQDRPRQERRACADGDARLNVSIVVVPDFNALLGQTIEIALVEHRLPLRQLAQARDAVDAVAVGIGDAVVLQEFGEDELLVQSLHQRHAIDGRDGADDGGGVELLFVVGIGQDDGRAGDDDDILLALIRRGQEDMELVGHSLLCGAEKADVIRDAGADIAPEPLVADHKETPNAAGDQGRRQPRKQRRTHDILQHHRA